MKYRTAAFEALKSDAFEERIKRIDDNNEWEEAVDAPYDTFEE